jgi:hypothetical protein
MSVMVSTDKLFILNVSNTLAAIIQGESRLVLGRPKPSGDEEPTGGVEVDVSSGDVVVVPAGVSHRSLTSSGGYRYIGVYPRVSHRLHDPLNHAVCMRSSKLTCSDKPEVAQQLLQGRGAARETEDGDF